MISVMSSTGNAEFLRLLITSYSKLIPRTSLPTCIISPCGESYVSMKTFSESRVSLALLPINAKVHSLMSCVKKILWASLAFFSLESLSQVLVTEGTFFRSPPNVPPLFNAVSHNNVRAVKLCTPEKTAGRFAFEKHSEPVSCAADCLAAKENTAVSPRNFLAAPHFFRGILAPKISRYIFKSVLNI